MEFEQFARERLPALVRFTAAVCADRAVAEDVVQEVLTRVYRQWPRISQLDSPEIYVRRALINEYLSWRRKWSRVVPRAAITDNDAVTADRAEQHADRSELADGLARLAPRQRAAIVMRFYLDLPDQDIAALLRCRPVTVRSYISRGLIALRVELAELRLTGT